MKRLTQFNWNRALKSLLWGLAGMFISLTIIPQHRLTLLSYPLFILSLLMFALACWQFYKDNRE